MISRVLRRFPALALLAIFSFTSPLVSSAVPSTPAKPNIVVILVDDMGWSDIGCYG